MSSPNSRDDRYEHLINRSTDAYSSNMLHDSYSIQLSSRSASAPMGQYSTAPLASKYIGSSTAAMNSSTPDLKSHVDMEHQHQHQSSNHSSQMTKAELRKVIMINWLFKLVRSVVFAYLHFQYSRSCDESISIRTASVTQYIRTH